MNEYYENGPEGMPRVERMTKDEVLTLYNGSAAQNLLCMADVATLKIFADDVAEEILFRLAAAKPAPVSVTQPQPVTEQGAQRIHPPEFPKFCASSIEGTMSPEDLWDYACLTGWRTGHFAASQQAAEPVATKWAIYYDNLGEQPYASAWMAEWHLYNSEEEARAQIAHFTFGKHYIPKKVEVYLADAAPAIQQPQDERATKCQEKKG